MEIGKNQITGGVCGEKVFLVILVVFLASLYMAVDLTMYVGDATMGRNMSYVVEIYEKEHPNVNIDVVTLPYYGGFMEKVSLSLMSGEAPDLVQITTAYIPQVGDYLINLSPYIQGNFGMSPQDFKNQIYDVTSVYMGSGDIVHAVPLEFTVHGLWVNKEMFEKANITYPPLGGRETPWTWKSLKKSYQRSKKQIKYHMHFLLITPLIGFLVI